MFPSVDNNLLPKLYDRWRIYVSQNSRAVAPAHCYSFMLSVGKYLLRRARKLNLNKNIKQYIKVR